MAITTNVELRTAIANWLNRSDLTDRIPEFIALAEAKLAREVRAKTLAATISINASPHTLPADCRELRSIRLSTGNPHLDLPIEICTLEMLAEVRARRAAVAGRPTHAAVVEGALYFAPEPAATYNAFITYYQDFTPLATATTNYLLEEAPDAYLYGALSEAEPYLLHDERVPLWQGRFQQTILAINAQRNAQEFSASLRPARLPRVFG